MVYIEYFEMRDRSNSITEIYHSPGDRGPMAKNFMKFITKVSGVKDSTAGRVVQVLCLGRKSFCIEESNFCTLRGAIARENALLQPEPHEAAADL